MPKRRGRKTSLDYEKIRGSLVDIAESVQRTLELMGAREEWCDRVKRWCAAVDQAHFLRQDWYRRKKEYADAAKADKKLSRIKGKAPKGRGGLVVDEDWGLWVPKELHSANEPGGPADILPLGKRVLSLEEEYVLLAAIHDTCRDEDDRIITEANMPAENWVRYKNSRREHVDRQEVGHFSAVCTLVWTECKRPTHISLDDMDRLRGYLGDVEKDLLAKVTPIYDPAQVSERAASYAGAATAVLAAARENRKAGKFKEGIPDKWTWVCRSYDELRQSLWGYREFTALLTECDPRTEEFEFTRGETPGERLAAEIQKDWGESQLERLSQAANRLAAAVAAACRKAQTCDSAPTTPNEARQLNDQASHLLEWRDDADDYIPNSLAIKLTDGRLPLPRLSKLLVPSGPIRYMRKPTRCKVHIGDFTKYMRTSLGSEISDAAIESYLEGAERTKRELRS